jgi:chemotaxis protein CheX
VEIHKQIIEATSEIFSTMVMMEITGEEPSDQLANPLFSIVTGMVGLAGTHRGILAIHTPYDLAKTITANFLGIEVEEIDNDVKDAIGELANMIGGSVKSILSQNGKDISLSLPSVISGAEYNFNCQVDGEIIVIPFSSPSGSFHVELQYKKTEDKQMKT